MSGLFPGAAPSVSLGRQIACVEREITMRERVYPGWVDKGRMTNATADQEIAAMKAVLATLKSLNKE